MSENRTHAAILADLLSLSPEAVAQGLPPAVRGKTDAAELLRELLATGQTTAPRPEPFEPFAWAQALGMAAAPAGADSLMDEGTTHPKEGQA